MIKIKIYNIKSVYKILDKLKLKLAPDKTYIGNMTGGWCVRFFRASIKRCKVTQIFPNPHIDEKPSVIVYHILIHEIL